jgi:hypothetical protein
MTDFYLDSSGILSVTGPTLKPLGYLPTHLLFKPLLLVLEGHEMLGTETALLPHLHVQKNQGPSLHSGGIKPRTNKYLSHTTCVHYPEDDHGDNTDTHMGVNMDGSGDWFNCLSKW